jgi:hypothetical protein
MMLKILNKLKNINDERHEWKAKHKLMDVVAIVLFATIANADEWEKLKKIVNIDGKTMIGSAIG